jgi:hypothetical protein
MTDLFSAASSATGYLYQVRVALLCSLRRLPISSDFSVSIETLDDVVFHDDVSANASELLQTKHHISGKAALSDRSPDLWKTLRIWFERHSKGQVSHGTGLHLLTTAIAPQDGIASKLRATQRDVDGAAAALEAVALTSSNKENEAAYQAFLGTSPEDRKAILADVVVSDAFAGIVSRTCDNGLEPTYHAGVGAPDWTM